MDARDESGQEGADHPSGCVATPNAKWKARRGGNPAARSDGDKGRDGEGGGKARGSRWLSVVLVGLRKDRGFVLGDV